MDIKIIVSNRGKPMLVVNSYKYSFQKQLKISKENMWKCVNRDCKSIVYTVGIVHENILISRTNTKEHSHVSNLEALNRQIVSSACKRKSVEELAEKPAKIIRRVLQEDLPATLSVVDVEYVRKNMYNSRRKLLPALPRNISEVHSKLEEITDTVKTNLGEPFVFINNKEEEIIVFSCERNIQALGTATRIYLDGTFDYCTKYFCQLLTIHGYFNGHYVPLLFALLPNKHSSTYEIFFLILVEKCDKINIKLNICEVVIDFERAIHKAVEKVWPIAKIIGCRFHLLQAWFRKIQKFNLIKEYNDKSCAISQWLRMTFALTYLSPAEVGDCFTFELFEIMPDDNRVVQYADYLTDTYISEESLFPPHLWAELSATLLRTTNACESFHRHFNDSMYKAHPNLYVLIEKLKEFQIDTYIKLQSLNKPAKTHNIYVKNRQKFIENTLKRYSNGEITRLHLLKCISFACEPQK